MKLPEKNLKKLDLKDIKEQLRYADCWDDVIHIKEYCEQILQQNKDYNKELIYKYSLLEIFEKLRELEENKK